MCCRSGFAREGGVSVDIAFASKLRSCGDDVFKVLLLQHLSGNYGCAINSLAEPTHQFGSAYDL